MVFRKFFQLGVFFVLVLASAGAWAQCPTFNTVTSTNVTCNPGPNDGTITMTLNANGYSGNYNYQILGIPSTGPIIFLTFSTTSTTHTFTGLAAATYTVFVSPDSPCGNISGAPQFITQPTVLTSSTIITPACTAGAGSIDLIVSGGNGGNTFLWSPGGEVSEDISGLSGGSYSVAVTDLNGCSINVGPLLVAGPPTTSSISGDSAPCENETGVAYSVNNTAGSTYAWTITNGTQASGTNTNAITVNWSATSPGSVQVVETNSGGCVGTPVTLATTITAPPTTSAITGSTSVCVNQTGVSYVVTSTPGSTYAWTVPAGATAASGQGSASITVDWASTSGNVQVIETNSAGCVGTVVTTAVTVNPTNLVTPASSSPTLCINTALVSAITHTTTGATGIGSATGLPSGVSASFGGNTITISGTPTASGTFNYSIPLTGGCGSVDATGTIVVTPDNTAGAPSSTPTLCINDPFTSITHATTGATGISNDGISGANGLPAGVNATWSANTITISGTPSASGTFNYSIPLSGGCGSINATGTITVTPANTASVASSSPTPCVNTLMTTITHNTTGATGIGAATGLPSGVIASFLANQITISGTPTATGTFNYSIPLSGGCGSVNATGTITVLDNNTVGLASSSPTVCAGSALTAITHATTGATGIGVATGLPTGVSAGFAGNTISITGTPTSVGTFNYSIPLTGGCGGGTATGTIVVNAVPTGSVSGGGTVCSGATLPNVQFTFTGTAPFDFTYSDGTSTVNVNDHASTTYTIFNAPAGTYTLTTLTDVGGAGCTQNTFGTSATVTITALTLPTISGPPPPEVCQRTSVTFTTESGKTNYVWSFTGGGQTVLSGGSATDNSVTVSFGSTGAKTVNVHYVDNGCTSQTATKSITVRARPNLSLTGPATVCETATGNVYTTNNGLSNYTWSISPGGTVTAGGGITNRTATVTWTTAGSQSVSVNATNGFGCTDDTPPTVNVTVNPMPSGQISGTTTICSGSSALLTFTLPSGTFDVDYTDGTSTFTAASISSGATVNVSPAANTTYTISSITSAAGCTVTAPNAAITGNAIITVSPSPSAGLAVSAQSTTICEGSSTSILVQNSQAGVSYQLRNNADNSLIGSAIPGTGAQISLPTGALTAGMTFNVLASLGSCNVPLSQTATVAVDSAPNLALVVSATLTPLCTGGSTTISVQASEAGASYQLRDGVINIGTAVAGSGATLLLPTGALAATTTFNVLVTKGTCSAVQLTNTATVTVTGAIDASLTLAAQTDPVCEGGSTVIQVTGSEAGVSYQLRDDATNANIGTPVAGTGGTIDLPTGVLSANTTFNVLATSGSCSVQLTQTVAVGVTILPLTGLTVTAQSASVCPSTATAIQIQNSEASVSYQLRNALDNSSIGTPVNGTGGSILLPTGNLSGNMTFNVLATRGTCSVQLTTTPTVTVLPAPDASLASSAQVSTLCAGSSTAIDITASEVGVNYQLRNDAGDVTIGSSVPGTGGTISLATGALASTTTFNVLASLGSCSVELTQLVTVTVNPNPAVGLTVMPSVGTVCAGGTTDIQVASSEVGVSYQLRTVPGNSLVGGAVPGTGGTILLPTGSLVSTTTFNVLATLGSCSLELTQTATVNTSPVPLNTPGVMAQAATVCAGSATNIQVSSSEVGVTYQLRNDLDDSAIGTGVVGTGGTIDLSTGAVAANMTFNVLATLGSCSVELAQTASVTVTIAPSVALTVSAAQTPICAGTSTTIDVAASEVGVTYQLRNDLDDSLIGGAQIGTGGTLNFPTGVLAGTTVYNVTAQSGVCTVEMTLKPQVIVNPTPSASPAVSTTATTICAGGQTDVQIVTSENGVTYQLRNDLDDSIIGSATIGTGGTIAISTGSVFVTTTINVLATSGTCATELSQKVTITTVPGASALLSVSAQAPTVCSGSATNILVASSEVGVTYQLRNDADDSAVGVSVAGDGSTLALPTGVLTNATTFNVLASSATCSVELLTLATVSVDNPPAINLSLSATSPICEGQTSVVTLTGSESGVSYQLRDGTTSIGAAVPGTGGDLNFGTGTLSTTTTFNILATRGVCAPVQLTNTATVTVNPIAGDNTVFGGDTWIAYVYNDGNITTPSDVDFAASKYKGFFTETELDAFGSSTYNTSTDEFDLNLLNSIPVAGTNICGSYLNDYSIRFRMAKSMSAGVYTFTVGGDDGVRLFIDGSPITVTRTNGASPSNSFTDHSYGTYRSDAICLTAGSHDFVIEYYENSGFSRVSFAYQGAVAPSVSTPVSVCVNSTAPTLTASSTDAGVTGFNWYSDVALTNLVASTQNYTPSATDLDMTVAGISDFFVVATFACGQSQAAQVDVSVVSTASITPSSNPVQICQSAFPLDLTTVVSASPSGGTLSFAGTGVTANNFDASQALGMYPISVSYTSGGCSANTTFDVEIINSATITVPASTVSTCQSSLPIDLTTLVSATPVSGAFTFSGAGVSGSTFDPSVQSGLVTITVDYVAGTCSDSKTFDINVATSATLTTSNTIICPNAGLFDLTSLVVSASPSGGLLTFSGSTAITGSQLDPTFVAGSIVTVNVQYTVGGCTASSSLSVSVRSSGDAACGGGGGTGTCATVVITPVPSPATCTLSNGGITFNINPAVPVVNNTGVKITIDGISATNQAISRTNFNDPVFANLPIGTYDYTIEYGDPSCVKTGQVTIDRSGTVGVPALSNVQSTTCFGTATGSVTIDVPGETGNLLEWSLDGLTWTPFVAGNQVTGLAAGDIVVSVRRNSTDPCASGALLTVPDAAELVTTLTATDASCNNNDGTILVGPITGGTAPYSFEFDTLPLAALPAADTFTGLSTGDHTLQITDAMGCSKSFTVTVSFPGFVNHTALVGSAPGCSPDGTNGVINFTINDPGTYLVGYTTDPVAEPTNYFDPLNAVVNISGLTNGDWYVWMKPSTGSVCATKETTPVTIQGIVPVSFDEPESSELNCPSDLGSVLIQNITGAPGLDYTYELVEGTNVYTGIISAAQASAAFSVGNLPVGSYSLRVMQVQTSLNALCATPVTSVSKSFALTSAPPLDLTVTLTDATCSNNDGSILVESVSGGVSPYTFELNGNPVILSTANAIDQLPGDTYTLSVIDSKGCRKDYPSLTINFPGYVNITTPVGSSPSCLPDGSNGVINFQINQAGSYLVGYTTDLAAEPTNYFNPASQNVLIPGLANGNWFIWMKRSDGTGCVTKYPDPVLIEGVYPVAFEAQTGDIACFGEKASILLSNLSGAPGVDFSYTLTNSADNSTIQGSISFAQSLGQFSITDVTPGNYSLLLSQIQSSVAAACTSPILSESNLIEIAGPTEALDTLYVVESISLPDMATGSALIGLAPSGSEPYEASMELLEPLFPGQSYFADFTTVNLNAQNFKFERTFTNLYSGTYELNIRDAAGCAKSFEVTIGVDTNISIPNIFTPNDDGVNDIFYIRNLPTDAALVITNRWGKEVFRSNSYQNDWRGGEAADGVYYFKLTTSEDSITGWVEILRGK